MRVHDNSEIEPDLNLEMLVTYQVYKLIPSPIDLSHYQCRRYVRGSGIFATSHFVSMRDYTPALRGKTGFSPNLEGGNVHNTPFRHFASILRVVTHRTVIVWFLIAQTVCIKTGVACDVIDGFRSLPLCSPKSLWEAQTPSAWQSEYDLYKSMPRMGLDVFGDLIDACKQSDGGSSKLKLDAWNAKIDNLGFLLRLSAMMT